MNRAAWAVAVALAAGSPAAWAVTQDNFHVRTAGDLVELCSASASDPMRVAALHFCEGYVVGAYQYYETQHAAEGRPTLVCYPKDGPSRDEFIQMYVTWARKNPQNMDERPIDSLFRFASAMWPCAK
jgi:hypothetical protein